MRSNFFDLKFLKIIICCILFLCVFGIVLNRSYISKFINTEAETHYNDFQEYSVTDDGLYSYYIAEPEDSVKEVFITRYNGNEKNVIIPNKIDNIVVTKIGDSCFTLNNEIISVEIPDTITHIGTCAFAGCEKLESITIPNSVETIDPYAFVDSNKLTVYFSENSKAINYARDNNIKYKIIE